MPHPEQPALDFTSISFPSDRLTFKHLRAFDQKREVTDNPGLYTREGERLDAMQFLERQFALLGFEAAFGRGDQAAANLALGFEQDGVDGAAADLADLYTRYGLATGPAAARELVKSVQAEGSKQAAKVGGRPR